MRSLFLDIYYNMKIFYLINKRNRKIIIFNLCIKKNRFVELRMLKII